MKTNKGRAFGEDLMRGEGGYMGASKVSLSPGGGGGGVWLGGPDDANTDGQGTGTSIFDPVLCELIYRWFSPKSGTVLDPFAGGSVRGIVASHLGRHYHGVELRQEQVEANNRQIAIAAPGSLPVWAQGDSMELEKLCCGKAFDFLFSCPPYGSLEVYSDLPEDISGMEWPQFIAAYRAIIKAACWLLKDNVFACFVVGEFRDKAGNYRNFVGETVQAFEAAGLRYYNEAVLITACGSLPLRVGRQFRAGRKLGKTHQNVLVFVKGDAQKATAKIKAAE